MKINILNPDINKLAYVIAIASINDKHDRSTPSDYHWKILKCRMIIFSSSSILACPDKNDVKQVHVIFNKAGDNYDKLNSLFIKFSLVQDGEIKSVTTEIFQKCFHYTMTARIAPVWNTLGNIYLINNRDFLTAKGPQEGVKYNISINEEEEHEEYVNKIRHYKMKRTIWVEETWRDRCTLGEYFTLCIYTVIEINAVKINLMKSKEDFLPGEWIRVLPSLNKAIIEDTHKDFTQISKFKSYKDLRRHWKNIHGYRLPEEESSYYSIQFWRGEPLLYPKLCIIRNFPIVTPTPKPLETVIISRFLNCLNSKMTNILGMPLIIKIQDIQHENDNSILPNDSLSGTQAVSLCTPTQ